jgi:ABC-type transporter Mla subunit MlaD
MKRIALTLVLLACAAATVVTAAGASGDRTYQAELFNGFGLVKGSELRVAGVKAGTVTDLDVTAQKTALITFTVGSDFPELHSDASCSSEPQSLIAEYFLDCQPGSSTEPLTAPIPAAHNQTTVQGDLVQNTLREPFKRRFQLLINEFGTALTGNAENLNAAIRSGAPALRELRKVLQILGRQNQIIAGLNSDSDVIFQKLTDRREDVVNFIDNAGRAAAISAERRSDLAANFDKLDDFLFELKPVMEQLGNLAREQTPLLTDLHAAAPNLNKLATNLPAFNDATRVSLKSLSGAAAVGKRAFTKAQDEIAALNVASTKAYPAADIIAKFLESVDEPRNATEEDCQARVDIAGSPADPGLGEAEANRRQAILEQRLGSPLTGTRSCDPSAPAGSGNPGYTGLEGLLNYAYIQTLSLNLFDQLGHALHFTLANAPGSNPCAEYAWDWSAQGGGKTTNAKNVLECAGILGDTAPGINYGTNPSGLFGNLPRYDPRVCPMGSLDTQICNPADAPHGTAAFNSAGANAQQEQQQQQAQQQQQQIDDLLGALNDKTKDKEKRLRELLGLPPAVSLPSQVTQGIATGTTDRATSNDLLNFLFGP